jgi:hypothetical protein
MVDPVSGSSRAQLSHPRLQFVKKRPGIGAARNRIDRQSAGMMNSPPSAILRFRIYIAVLALCVPVFAQSYGELRLKVADPQGLGVKAELELISEANEYRNSFVTDDSGALTARHLPLGVYRVEIRQPGFAAAAVRVEVLSAIPVEVSIRLTVAPVTTSVVVNDKDTLIDPHRAGSATEIGSQSIQSRPASLPGRSLEDLVNSQPGWLYEGNAVLHPRGSEYQTQFVVDGIPLSDNRSPSFGSELEADDVESLTILTSGIPAEFGRKMGGVIEVNTLRNAQPGLHGDTALSGGSFDTAGAFARIQDSWGENTAGASASGDMTARYLNPVVPQNYTNDGTTADFSLSFERNFTPRDHLALSVRHELSRYEIPNEDMQENPQLQTPPPAPGTPRQLQTGDNFETMGIASYQHIFSSNLLADVRGMARSDSSDLNSNPFSWPLIARQHNSFGEGYFNGTISLHHGHQEWKAGVESDNMFLRENFSDVVTAKPSSPDYPFDPGTPAEFAFFGNRPDLEQAAFVQDLIHFGKWTIDAGLRWDHYQLLVNQNAVSPRFSVARYFPAAGLMLHASYDRIFQTPSFENILLSSSSQVVSLNPNVLRLPVEPSHGNYFEAGATKAFFSQLRLDANYFRRSVNNYADDDQILSTAVSFPIAFRKALIYGAEGKIEIPKWGRFSGFASYSYMVGNAWFPVTGGLFLGDDAVNATTQLTGHFPDSQDQRNTVRLHLRYQLFARLWLAGGAEYGSGLPFDFTGTYQEALSEYGQAMINQINFSRGRVRPNLAIDSSAGADVYKTDKAYVRLQFDAENINNRLNVLDFGGLFSGNAVAPPRSYAVRLQTTF